MPLYFPGLRKLSDLTDVVVQGSWTPADGSGAALTFTSVTAKYERLGNTAIVYASLTYPSTADGTSAKISGLPFALPNRAETQQGFVTYTGAATAVKVAGVLNTSNLQFYAAAGTNITNATMSLKQVIFTLIYPIT